MNNILKYSVFLLVFKNIHILNWVGARGKAFLGINLKKFPNFSGSQVWADSSAKTGLSPCSPPFNKIGLDNDIFFPVILICELSKTFPMLSSRSHNYVKNSS